ncbi:hypothetical protein [Myxosarcina sp. GI1]|uniref:hypothetical protein n=1 Tax=Myxosarcina sp. GI1 TaxID=1541065 RepID=UPI000567AF48|nr:hypothetical protein [Myxosarcina sp. GI1]
MTFNIAVEHEQDQRIRNDLAARDARIEQETDWYTDGEFDGIIAIDPNPELWGKLPYREGFLIGLARHFDRKYQTYSSNQPF